MNDLRVSKHGGKRIRSRVGGSKKSVDRIALRAFTEGITHSETRGNLHKWLTSKHFAYGKNDQFRIYGDKLYVFQNDSLVTVLDIPKSLLHLVKDAKDRREKNLIAADDLG